MRIALLSDIHANLPFAEAAIRTARRLSSDRIVHLGDAIDLGPWPSETLDYLVAEGVELIRGNHDEYPVMGLTAHAERAMTEHTRRHMEWTHRRLRVDQLALLATLPVRLVRQIDRFRVRLQHFLITDGRVSDERLDSRVEGPLGAFNVRPGEIVCFGHTHERLWRYDDRRGCLNPGATGFCGDDGAMLCQLIIQENAVWTSWHSLACDASVVVKEFQVRRVPAWEEAAHYMFAVPA